MLAGKIHRATVTDANVDYIGSITVDADLLDAAGILEGEKVHVVDVTNGARLETYTIAGARGSGEVCMNGAAAHLIHRGHLVIILAYILIPESEARTYRARKVTVDEQNRIVSVDVGDTRHASSRV